MSRSLLADRLGATALAVTLNATALSMADLGTVTIRHGRSNADGQPDASTCQLVCYADAYKPGGTVALPAIGQALAVELGASARTPAGLAAAYRTNALIDSGLEGASIPTEIGGYFNPPKVLDTASPHSGAQCLKMTTDRTDFGQGIIWQAPSMTAVPFGVLSKAGLWVKGPAGVKIDVRGWANNPAGSVNFSQSKASTQVTMTGAWQYAETAGWTVTLADSNTAGYTAYRPAVAATLVPPAPALGTVVMFDDGLVTWQVDTAWDAARRRFVGTVTDVKVTPDPDGRGILTITAVGPLSRLGRIVIGDTPWPAETDGTRAGRILALAATAAGVTVGTVDPGTVDVLGRDVDAQPALGLVADLAGDAGGLVVQRRDGVIEYHDAVHRQNVAPLVALDAGNVLAPASWDQTIGGLINDVSLSYGVDAGSGQAVLRVTDPESITAYGSLAASVQTKLSDLDDATTRATDLVGRRSRPRWELPGMVVDMLRVLTADELAALAQAEVGALITITGFPAIGPYVTARVYVEGWTESFGAGGWRMDIDITEYGLTGASPRWVDVPDAVTWASAPSDLTWLGAAGWYAGEVPGGRWVDVAADLNWPEIDNTRTWATEP